MTADRIASVEWGLLEGRRPRLAGSNARLGAHGGTVRVSLARITTANGASGFGVCWAARERAAELLGQPMSALFTEGKGVGDPWLAFDYPLWDLAGKLAGRPVYALARRLPACLSPTPAASAAMTRPSISTICI